MDIKRQIYDLKYELKDMDIQLTICHNDPLCENFIKGSDRMYLVDWEYAGMNDPMWDLADLFIEAEFTHEEENVFCQYYFESENTLDSIIKHRILINKILLDFLWSLWGRQRCISGEDLLDYADKRYIRAKEKLKQLYAHMI